MFLLGVTHTPDSLHGLLMLENKGWDGLSPFIASDWLVRQSLAMPRDSEAFKKLCYRIRQQALLALDTLKLRTEGIDWRIGHERIHLECSDGEISG